MPPKKTSQNTGIRPGQVIERGIQYRGPGQYRVQIRERGQTVYKTCQSLEEARAFQAANEGARLGRRIIDHTLPRQVTLADAANWAITELLGEDPSGWKKANDKNLISKWRWWRDRSPFRAWMLADIKNNDLTMWSRALLMEDVGDDLDDLDDARLEVIDLEGDDKPVSPQTIIHRLNALNKLVQEWRLANGLPENVLPDPVTKGVRPPNSKGRRRRLHEGEEGALIAAMAASSRVWLPDAVTIAIESGMRQTELAKLTWERVRLDDEHPYAHLPETKNGRERNVPLSDRAIEAFRQLKELADEHNDNPKRTVRWEKPLPVETGRGVIHAFRDAIQAWHEAGNADLDDLRWHDLRHEAVSRFFELTDLGDTKIMAIVGHLSRDMLEHYATLRTKQFREYLPTADGAKGDPAGTVKLRPGKPAVIKTLKGRWVRLLAADEILLAYARSMLSAAADEIKTGD